MADKFLHILFRHRSRRMGTDCLKHTGKTGFSSLYMTGKHRAAAHKYRRYIDPRRCHQKPRHVFITVWHHHKRVKRMCHRHTLRRIRDQIPRDEGIFHSDMPHRDPVTDGDRREYDRRSARHRHAEFYCLYHFIKIHVSRHNFIIRTDDTDQWFVKLFLCHAQSVKQRTLWSSLHTFFYRITFHNLPLFCAIWRIS